MCFKDPQTLRCKFSFGVIFRACNSVPEFRRELDEIKKNFQEGENVNDTKEDVISNLNISPTEIPDSRIQTLDSRGKQIIFRLLSLQTSIPTECTSANSPHCRFQSKRSSSPAKVRLPNYIQQLAKLAFGK